MDKAKKNGIEGEDKLINHDVKARWLFNAVLEFKARLKIELYQF